MGNLGFGDYAAALKMRDLVGALVAKALKDQRPANEFAEVVSLDRAHYQAVVHYPADPAGKNAIVKMGSIQPKVDSGTTVLISGEAGKRYIAAIFGDTRVVGIVIPTGGGGGGLEATDNGDGTFTLDGASVVDNGDGTYTVS